MNSRPGRQKFVRIPAPLAMAIMAIMLIGGLTAFVPIVSAATPNVTVNGQTNSGTTLTGYWVEVATTSGTVVQTGFTPAQFTLAAGSYEVTVGNYGSEYFNHWSDGVQAGSHAITVGSSGTVALDRKSK